MSLHKLCRTGLLFEESYNTLQFMQNENDWKKVIEKLYNIGLASSQNRAYELISEIKKRLIITQDFLPDIRFLQELSKTKINIKTMKEILLSIYIIGMRIMQKLSMI